MRNIIKNISDKFRKTDKKAPQVSREDISREELEELVKQGTERAMREYGKTFEILRDYDRS